MITVFPLIFPHGIGASRSLTFVQALSGQNGVSRHRVELKNWQTTHFEALNEKRQNIEAQNEKLKITQATGKSTRRSYAMGKY